MKKKEVVWTLFLDRDGVINKRLPDDYVKVWHEFEFLPKTLKALNLLRPLVKYIFVVTNQQGISKGLMNLEDLSFIHKHLKKVTRKNKSSIDEIYFCPDLAEDDPPCRKPNIGMGLKAKSDFPDLDFKYSIMVGDSPSDIEFGKKLQMKTVFIDEKMADIQTEADYTCHDLMEFYRIFELDFTGKFKS